MIAPISLSYETARRFCEISKYSLFTLNLSKVSAVKHSLSILTLLDNESKISS